MVMGNQSVRRIVRGRVYLNKLARRCTVPRAENGELASVGNGTMSGSLPISREAIFSIFHRRALQRSVSSAVSNLSYVGSTQSLRLCLFEHALLIPNISLQFHRTTQIVQIVDCMRLGTFDVSVCIVKPIFAERQLRQVEMVPEQVIVPVERGCDFEGCLVVIDGLFRFAS